MIYLKYIEDDLYKFILVFTLLYIESIDVRAQ